jgi:hypothetical protein
MDAQTRPQVFGKPRDAVSHTAHRHHRLEKGGRKQNKTTDPYLEPLSLEANTG